MKIDERSAMATCFTLALLCSAALVSSAVAPAVASGPLVPVGQSQA